MVDLLGLSIPGSYLGIGVAVVIGIILFWLLKNRSGGRIGEERVEERETDELRADEIKEVKIQKDERKECIKLDKLFSEIMLILRKNNQNDLANELMNIRGQISSILIKEMGEKMSVKAAVETFRQLNTLISQFLSHLPNDDGEINGIVQEIRSHEERYYQDLIKELEMNRAKKLLVSKLWRQITDQDSGTGQAKAA